MTVILVTGGVGFIGSHLCEYLLNKGNEVIYLDNFFTSSKKNVSYLPDNKNFKIIRHDIIKPIYLEVDEIYNLACPKMQKFKEILVEENKIHISEKFKK